MIFQAKRYFLFATGMVILTTIFFTNSLLNVPSNQPVEVSPELFKDMADDLLREKMKILYISENLKTSRQSLFQYCNRTFQSKHYMTIHTAFGRLGNNMFQFLALLATSIDHCYTPVITDILGFSSLDDVFDMSFIDKTTMIPKGWSFFKEHEAMIYSYNIRWLDHRHNWTFYGYFQSWRYFERHKQFILSILKFRKDITEPVLKYINTTGEFRNKTKICVHHRRGDFLEANHLQAGFSSASMGYFNKSMEYFMNKLDTSVVFIYLSDDIEWCKRNIKRDNVYYSPFSSSESNPGQDMALMTYCDHCIITGGTFGWIGAWFSNGHVVYYKGYPKPGSQLDITTCRENYYPPYWIGMS